MKIPSRAALLLVPLVIAVLANCNDRRGQPRNVQLEETAETLETKAEKVLIEVEESAEVKIEDAKQVREQNGNEKTAEMLEKDASVIREVGKMRAEQLMEKAEDVRDKKE